MPVRTRHAPSAATEAPETEEEQGGVRRLRFNETLSWRAGKAIPVADLLRRLESLASELHQLEQEETDRGSLTKVSQELASGHLLGHKDKGVRAWAACCVVDILRLCAPDAPFTAGQLKDVFTTIVMSIIPALVDPSNAYNEQHVKVLSSLAEVKSIVLLTDLDAPDNLILSLFTSCFDIVSGSPKTSSGEELAKNVEYDMTRLLVTVIDEAANLSTEVVDIILAQFLRVDPKIMEIPMGKHKKNGASWDAKQDTLLLKDYPPAYNMAKAICNACPEKMTSYVSQYFNNVIIDASGPGSVNGLSKHSANRRLSLDESEDEGENIKELSKAHRLIRELWRACPDVLQNVIPQLEAELSAESVSLRLLATQTIGDLAAGIGVAGPPPPAAMDPAAYPPVTLIGYSQTTSPSNVLLTPISPKTFSQAHSTTYESFLSRRQDKAASVRAAWAVAIGRILLASNTLSESEEKGLVTNLKAMLRDADERVRLSAVGAVGTFGFSDIVTKLGANGDFGQPDSILSILAERVKDRKHAVREHAMKILGRIWGVASGEIEANNDQVVPVLKEIPSRIFDAYYTNDPDIQVLLDHVIFTLLLPLSYPPVKSKPSKPDSTQSRKLKGLESEPDVDAEKVRVQRILTLVRGLDEKSKKVFFALQARQLSMRTCMMVYLTACEEYNGGVIDKDEEKIKAQLTRVIDTLAKTLPDSSKVSADLWKFAKMHDRRNYQLIRYAMAATSDYRTVTKAIKELSKRLTGSTSGGTNLLGTLNPLLYRSSSLIFNRSHIPAIMELSRGDDQTLANTAHEILRETSSRNPEVLEAHVQDMCKDLESQAPSAKQSDDPGVDEILKACVGFSKRLPTKLPTDRKFLTALTNYALYSSSPSAAKHAVSILMVTADKKQMYAADLIKKSVQKCNYGSEHFLTKLATISQLNLLAPEQADREGDAIISIATNQTLLNNCAPEPSSGYAWSETVDEETAAKEWALRLLVNRVRARESSDDEQEFRAYAEPVFQILNTLVSKEGELSKNQDTPASQKSRLRLLAAKSILKLCSSRALCEQMFSPRDFNAVSLVAQDQLVAVRTGFISQLKKRLIQKSHLGPRWYTIAFLLAFEPNASLKDSTLTWLRSRATFFSRQPQTSGKGTEQQTIMESTFARLISLLAYHPDYPSELSDESTRMDDLADFARYILFYLSAVANENNLSLIFHIAQRVKQTRDAISASETISTNLHTLSDLAQATIRRFAELYSQQHKIGGSGGSGAANILQTYPGKMRLPSSLFANMASHREVQEVIEKNHLPEEVDDRLDRIVRSFMKPKSHASHSQNVAKKRKVESSADAGAHGGDASPKKAKKSQHKSLSIRKLSSAGTSAKTTKKRKNEDDWEPQDGQDVKVASTSRRRSGRGSGKTGISYAEGDSEEDDMQMERWDQRDEPEDEAEAKESDAGEEPQAGEQPLEAHDNQAASDRDSTMEDVEKSSTPPPAPPPRTKSTPAKKPESPTLEVKRKRGRKPKPKPETESPGAPANEVSTRRSTRRAR